MLRGPQCSFSCCVFSHTLKSQKLLLSFQPHWPFSSLKIPHPPAYGGLWWNAPSLSSHLTLTDPWDLSSIKSPLLGEAFQASLEQVKFFPGLQHHRFLSCTSQLWICHYLCLMSGILHCHRNSVMAFCVSVSVFFFFNCLKRRSTNIAGIVGYFTFVLERGQLGGTSFMMRH